ncbi:MepB family protein [Leptospira sp. 2 VSF19]|uniref:MepB family protein n=1 Tax=Leptospira soteropolitanensis TaxID=2950025 RepID=A0AAW5VIH2_9LEPT|nr:MepB family protein [Leptospira soteropolitanensis]MCW7493800.1 MepB family protein [Leptospira soteropolitanensis]MCW7501396.1 MepB family protein [Leptospira soteropolitanensis]MCW7523418.1 MepB family protein [Leptospira soteropolitanensis]MCW7527511.1 MepB family protein [Leptospira soteropolitanensis]MCW7531366.1 MepB family protein [Leptospira soteropolitanensis]
MKSSSAAITKLPKFLSRLQISLFDPYQLFIKEVHLETESKDYNACYFKLKNKNVVFRTAKTTPKKIGQFVTLWKRNKNGPIEPFRFQESADLYIIETINRNQIGYFLFAKEILNEKGILFGKHKGKRGFRVYPSWDKPKNKQGNTTQIWQIPYFHEIIENRQELNTLKKQLEIFIK